MSWLAACLYIGGFAVLTDLLVTMIALPVIRHMLLFAAKRSEELAAALIYDRLMQMYWANQPTGELTYEEYHAMKTMWEAYTSVKDLDDILSDSVFQMCSWRVIP